MSSNKINQFVELNFNTIKLRSFNPLSDVRGVCSRIVEKKWK
jgi:hypothetical protein